MIHLILALRSEAHPILSAFKLKQVRQDPFPIYRNDSLSLTLSGIGQLNAACAVSVVQNFLGSNQDCWLNIGLAGHPMLMLGSPCLVSKVSSSSHKRVFYPALTYKTKLYRSALLSLDQPSSVYQKDTLFDMEAYGFYFAALKYSLLEKIQVIKVVSDNQKSSLNEITPKKASELIEQNLDAIEILIKTLTHLDPHLNEHPQLPLFLKHWSFSETQQHQLKQLLNTLNYYPDTQALFSQLSLERSKKEVLRKLSQKLGQVPL